MLGRQDGDGRSRTLTAQPTVFRGDDRRRLVPLALVSVLTTLIEDLPDCPSSTRVELRTIRARLCRVFDVPNPDAPASEIDVAHDVAEEDGEAIPETI